MHWWLYGSAASAVRGIDIAPGDIDVSVDDALLAGDIFDDLLVTPILSLDQWAARHFGRALEGAIIEWLAEPHAELVRPLVTLHRKLGHGLGGECEFGGGLGGLAVTPFEGFELAPLALAGAVAVADVVGERVAEGVPVEVVGVLADEFVDRAEGALDPVEVAGVGGGWNELHVVGVCPGADCGLRG